MENLYRLIETLDEFAKAESKSRYWFNRFIFKMKCEAGKTIL
jgi:hypothetical protein